MSRVNTEKADSATQQLRVSGISAPPQAIVKRKMSASNVDDAVAHKKIKMADKVAKAVKTNKPTENVKPKDDADAAEQVYCHQCRSKRTAAGTRRCTRILLPQAKKATEKQCTASYCERCLTTRYDIDVLSAARIDSCAGHKYTKSAAGSWSCPKCRDICSCSSCRHAKGLEPLGQNKHDKLEPAQTTSKTKEKSCSTAKPTDERKEKAKGTKSRVATTSATVMKQTPTERLHAHAGSSKGKGRVNPAVTLGWRHVYGDLNLDEAVLRMQIREFVVRFHHVMKPTLPKAVVEELETLASQVPFTDGDDALVGWVSEHTTKAVIVGLLSLLADGHQGVVRQKIQGAMKDARQTGVTLSKLWSVLETLRDSLRGPDAGFGANADADDEDTVLHLPDPLPLAVGTMHMTRKVRGSAGHVVGQSAQLVPVVAALVEAACATRAVHDTLDDGVQDAKEQGREMRDALKIENERWDTVRKTLGGKDKAEETKQRAAHKQNVQDIEDALKVILPAYAPRFAPLGTDTDGRLYYALTPALAQRDSAQAFLTWKAAPGMKAKPRRRRGRDIHETRTLKKWSTFVAVWGVPPEDARKEDNEDAEEEWDQDKERAERWSGFADPADIEALAVWVKGLAEAQKGKGKLSKPKIARASADRDECASGTLAKGLQDFAAALRWQLRGDDVAESGVAAKSIPCAKFYS